MASTYSDLKIQLMGTGENSGTWGNVTNVNLGTAIEEAITGSADVAFSSADVTLTLTDTNETQVARNLRLNLTGTSGGARNLEVPAIEKVYIINNGLADTVTVKNSTGTGVDVPAGKTMYVYNDGTNVVDAITHLSSLTTGALTSTSTTTLNGTTIPASKTLVDTNSTQTLSNKTLDDPAITGDLSIADKIVHTGDTNTAIRFPANDTVTIETAGSEALRVDSSGNVGIGTSSPVVRLDLSGTALTNSSVTGTDTFGLRANLHLSFAATALTLGNLNDQRNLSVRNRVGSTTTNTPVTNGIALAFEHYPGSFGNGSQYITQMVVGHANTPQIYYRNTDISVGTTFSNWFSVNLTDTSDIRSKKDIINAPNQLDILDQLEVKQFKYINDPEGIEQLGLIAQDVDKIAPFYVEKDEDNSEIMWRVHYHKMVPMLIKAVQEQQEQIEMLKAQMAALQEQ